MRRPLARAIAAACILVLLRSLVFLTYEQSNFDADQAIYGLMAKHMIEGRAFPLFMYGQQYMLAVDAFLAVPFIAVLGPTIFALHLSIVVTNLVVAALLVFILCRHAGLRPWQAVIATLPFTFPPPVTSASLTEIGGNIGPLLYVPLLWLVRRRPHLFGALLAAGTMAREFTIYALPVIVLQQAWTGELWHRRRLRAWLVAGVVAVATWQSVQALRGFTDVGGPGTSGRVVTADAAVTTVTERISFVPAELPDRVAAMAREHAPGIFGAASAGNAIGPQGHAFLFWPFVVGLTIAAAMAAGPLARTWRRSDEAASRADFPVFLMGVGMLAAVAYVLTRPADFFLDRYMLLVIYLPIGVVAAAFLRPPPAWAASTVTLMLIVMAAGAAVDHGKLWQRYWHGREPDHMRILADELVRRRVTVAMSTYFRAYKLTYYAGERVKVASSDFVRIDEYQQLARNEGARLLVIQDKPCPGAERFDVWYFCHPGPGVVP
jgi:hypothetical protein